MATIYICKCGRRVRKSTNADNTGNRDTAGCRGCPYLLPWGPTEWTGKGFEQNVQGHECRMSPEISYATDYSGSANDKCTLKIHSLDLDFLEDIQAWIDEYADGQLSGRFSRDTIRGTDYCNNGRYSWSISCAQNKKGMAAKAALIERFFGPDRHRLDKTPEEEKAIVLASIEAGKAKVKTQERKKTMDYIISKHEATGRLCAYYKGVFWFWDEHVRKWLLSQFTEDLYQERRKGKRDFDREDLLNQTTDFYLLDDYEVSSDCIEALLQCNPKTAKTAEKENPTSSAAATAAAEETVADDVCPYLVLIENSKKYSCQCSICGDRFVNTEICNKTFLGCGWYLDQQDKDALNHSEENTDKDNCLCRTCGSEECPGRGCSKECPNGSEGSCFTATCPGYIERTDIICKDKVTNAPSADAAATSDGSAARMCEGPDEETRTTPAAASGAALESLHAQAVLPQNAPAQDIAADAPSAQAFDYSGLDAETAERLQNLARRAMEAKQRYVLDLMEVVTEAHRELVARCDKQNNQHSENTFRAWCASIGVGKDTAYRLLQVQALMDGSTPEEQEALADAPVKLLYAAAKPSAPAELVQAVKDGDITTHKQFKELEAKLKAEREAREKAEQDVEYFKKDSEDARKAAHTYHCKYDEANAQRNALLDEQGTYVSQITAAELRAEEAERRARAAEEDAAGWKQAGLEMQEIVDQRDERIRELESGITVEAAAVDQEEIERRANELSEPLVKIINQQNEEIQQLAAGNTVSAQASVLEHYMKTMEASLLRNAQRAELASYDIGALDSLARALREFADSIDGIFEDRSEDND